MTRETLRIHLNNAPLVQAIEQKRVIDDTCKKLLDALQLMLETGISEAAKDEIKAKHGEYKKISHNYGILIETTWEVTWQAESIIKKYLDYCDEEIDELPDTVSF